MRSLIIAVLAVLLSLPAAGQAFAHAQLVAAVPAQSAVVATAPAAFELQFNEAVSPLVLLLVAPDGRSTALTQVKLVGTTLQITPPPGLVRGTYALTYRAISSDGHPVGGAVSWSIGMPSQSNTTAPDTTTDWTLRLAIWAGKLLVYLALFIGVGGVVTQAWLAPAKAARPSLVRGVLILGSLAAPLSVGLQGLDALGLPLSALWQPKSWTTGFSTSLGPSAALALLATGVALVGWHGHRWARPLSAIALLLLGLALSVTGHASAAEPQWLTRPAVFIHAVSIAVWAGALVPLLGLLRADQAAAVSTLHRFSRTIPCVLVALVGAGAVLAVIQLGSFAALTATAYGLVLLAKLALLAVVFVLAAINRWRLTKPVQLGRAGAARALLRIVMVETVLVIGVMGIAGLWRFTPPPRALALVAPVPLSLHIHTDKAMAEVTFASGAVGQTSASVFLMTGDFGPLEAKALSLVASSPAAGTGETSYPAQRRADGSWEVDPIMIPTAGPWIIQLDIRASEFEVIKIKDQIPFTK
ncbi:MAG: copper resistance CopC/CopD family protein [Cypionkella sp.]